MRANFGIRIAIAIFCVMCGSAGKKNAKGKTQAKSRDLEFTTTMKNLSLPMGQNAEFICKVNRLSGHGHNLQLVWIRLDTQTILAIEKQLVQNNPRINVTQEERLDFTLRIKDVQPEDAGIYACRINTKPRFTQMKAHLEVQTPPVFVAADTTEHVMEPEGSDVMLKCKAIGHPPPTITWTREDGQPIRLKGNQRTLEYKGATLTIPRLDRSDMATYNCMAANGVPPIISQKITVKVQFPPKVWVEPKFSGAWTGGRVELRCEVEAYPQAVLFWLREGNIITANEKYEIRLQEQVPSSSYRITSVLSINDITDQDLGEYLCTAENFHRKTEAIGLLHETHPPKNQINRDVIDSKGTQGDQSVLPSEQRKGLVSVKLSTSAAVNCATINRYCYLLVLISWRIYSWLFPIGVKKT